jgi:membrane-anchored protein YejM (alkaline phosphatase superfamily)
MGVRSNCAESLCGIVSILASTSVSMITPNAFSLLEVLKLFNYENHLILSGNHQDFYGLKEIYAKSDTYIDGSKLKKGMYSNDDIFVTDSLNKTIFNIDKNPFVYIHLMGVHQLGNRQESFKRWNPSEVNILKLNTGNFGETALNYTNNYDNGLLQTDDKIKDIVKIFKNKIGTQDFLLIITADHGDFLGEHNLLSHAKTVYEPVLQIPLLTHGFKNQFIKQLSTQMDIAPTLLYELDIPLPTSFKGKPLQTDNNRLYSVHYQGFTAGVVRKDGLKIIFNTRNDTVEAYNLSVDSGEFNNIIKNIDDKTRAEFSKQLLINDISLHN